MISANNAFGDIDPATHVRLAANKNPHLAWQDVPVRCKSLVLICHDPDVPSRGDDVNQDGKTVPADLPRVDFFHWSLIDLAPTRQTIAEGEFSDGVSAHGKPDATIGAARQGINDFTGWFATDAQMAGDYYGYDGPCPPWNDALVHRYVFTLYALDIARLALAGRFDGQQVRDAMRGHIIEQASIVGRYSLNPHLHPSPSQPSL
jgi:hypothetical protein